MDRRELLRLLTFSSVSATFGIGVSSLRAAIASESGSEWGYVGEASPDHWGDLSSTYITSKPGAINYFEYGCSY